MKSLFFFIFSSLNSIFNSESYKYIHYTDFNKLIDEIRNSSLSNKIIRIHNVFEIFTDIQPPTCPSDNYMSCKNYLIEIGDFEQGEDYVKQMPTVFHLAGIHGNEVIGTNSIYYFLKTILLKQNEMEGFKNLFQNVRILLLPVSNPSGFDRIRREEFINTQRYDANRDFPFNINFEDEQDCLVSTTAQIIDRIFQSNMIVGTLSFHGGQNTIAYPWGNFAHEQDPITGDNQAYKDCSVILQNIGQSNERLNIKQYTIGLLQDTVYDVNGGYEDWAYGASWDLVNVPNECNQKPYNVGSETNRAFTFIVEAGEKLPAFHTGGNEYDVFDPTNNNAVIGNISRNMKILIAFSEMMSPHLIIQKVEFEENVLIHLKVKGCLNFHHLKSLNQESTIKDKKYNPLLNTHDIILEIHSPIQEYQMEIELSCEIEKEKGNKKIPQSHFVRMFQDDAYYRESKDFKLFSLKKRNYKIYNVKPVPNLLIYSNNKQEIVFWENKKLQIYFYSIDILIELEFEDNNLIIISKQSLSEFNIQISNYGNQGSFYQHSQQNNYYISLNKNNQKITQQSFLDLIGKQVTLIDYTDSQNVHKAIIQPKDGQCLILPNSGLSSLYKKNQTYIYIEISKKEKNQLKVITTKQETYKILINERTTDLQFVFDFESNQTSYFVYEGNLEEIFLRGCNWQIYVQEELIGEGVFATKDPSYNEQDIILYDIQMQSIEKNQSNLNIKLLLITYIVLAITILFFIFLFLKYKKQVSYIQMEETNESIN